MDNGQSLDLYSGTNSLAWGIWRFNAPLKYFDSIEVEVDIPAGEEIWLALADFSQGTWDIDGPFTADHTLLPDEDRHRAADGNLYVAAIAYGGDQPSVVRLTTTIEDGWVIVTVDSTANVGSHPSMALVGGRPAISYYDGTNGDLKYAYSATATGSETGDWSVTTVDTGYESDVGQYTSLAVVEGQPAISYYDADGEALRYARRGFALPPNPPTWTRIEVDTDDLGTNVGKYTSLAVVNGKPLITYYDETNTALRHAVSMTETGLSPDDWVTYQTDNDAEVGEFSSLVEVDGKGAVSYYDDTNDTLKYKWFSDPARVSVASDIGICGGISLAMVDGLPAIGYQAYGRLYYAFSSSLHGTNAADWTTLEIHNGDTCAAAELVVVDGRPALSYWSTDEGAMETATVVLAWSTAPGGTNIEDWLVTDAINKEWSAGYASHLSMAEVDGKPAVCYPYKGDLEYAIRLGR